MSPPRSWARDLRPRRPVSPTASQFDEGELTSLRARLGSGPVDWALEVGQGMATHIEQRIPELAADGIVQDVRRGCETVALGVLGMLVGDADFVPSDASGVLTGPSELVARGVGSERMLHSLQLAHAYAHTAVVESVALLVPADEQFEETRRIAEVLFAVVDQVSAAMIDEFDTAYARWRASTSAARMDLIDDILRGRSITDGQAAGVLNYDLSRHHTAALVWSDERFVVGRGTLERAAAELLAAAGCTETLIQPVGRDRVWAWGATVSAPEPAETECSSVDSLAEGLRAAVGLAAGGVEGFRASHEQALEACRFATLVSHPKRSVFRYADLELLVLLTERPEAARQFVRRELGGLGHSARSTATVRDTLRIYLDTERSLQATAERLQVARNTVAYRVRRAEELRGRPVGHGRVQLQTALLLAHEMSELVLDPD